MTRLEKLKAAHEASTQGEWEVLGDFGHKVLTPNPNAFFTLNIERGQAQTQLANAEFIALAHGMMPQLLEAVEQRDKLLDARQAFVDYEKAMDARDDINGMLLYEKMASIFRESIAFRKSPCTTKQEKTK